MTTLFPLITIAKHYPWGSLHGIDAYTGRIDPEGRPVAELWMSAYPGAAADIRIPGKGTVPLDEAIAADPRFFLGDDSARQFGPELPFLFKLLSADSPLSLQVHPTAGQARKGYDAETAQGIPVRSSTRNYRDSHAKDELIMALTPFTALCGFREQSESASLFDLCGNCVSSDAIEILRGKGSWRDFLARLLSLDAETQKSTVRTLCERIASGAIAPRSDQERRVLDLVLDCAKTHPDDIGVLAPLYLNAFFLAPGEALFLPSGIMHAYIRGTGLELMTNSDNLLRCGLTAKHIDAGEMLSILDPEPRKPAVIHPEPTSGLFRYHLPVREFTLIAVTPETRTVDLGLRGPAVVFAEDGSMSVRPKNGEALTLCRGQTAFAAHAAGALSFSGQGRAYVATIAENGRHSGASRPQGTHGEETR